MSREDKVVEEERALERREVRDSRLSGWSCNEFACLTTSNAGGNTGSREEDEGEEATIERAEEEEEEEGSTSTG